MPTRRIGLACPLCDQVGVTSHLYETPPSLMTQCESGNPDHRWTDSEVLRQAHPRKLDLPKPVATRQENRVTLSLEVPTQLEAELRTKFGAALNNNVTSILQSCAQPEFLLLNMQDIDRIQERCGTRPTSDSELFGLLFQMGEELHELRGQVKQLERSAFLKKSGTGVMVDLAEFLPKAVGKAQEAGLELDDFLSQYLRTSVENDWITVT